MAVITLSLPDETHAKYVGYAPQNPNKALSRQLQRFEDVSPTDRYLVLTPENLAEIERAAKQTFETLDKLVTWVNEQRRISVAGVDMELSESQLKALEREAAFYDRPLADYLRQRVMTLINQNIAF